MQQQDTASPNHVSASTVGAQWSCNSNLCKIDQQTIHSTDQLLQKIASTDSRRCIQLYRNINTCTYTDKNPYKFGHSLSCSPENGCDSLLRHIRLISCHFPAIRSLVRTIYKLRHLSLCLQDVQEAKHWRFHSIAVSTDSVKAGIINNVAWSR